MTRNEVQGPWSRFALGFQARAGSRWAWRALLACLGLAVFAPLLANERPYFARFQDAQGYEEARALIVPIAQAAASLARESEGLARREYEALSDRLARIDAVLKAEGNGEARSAISDVRGALLRLQDAEHSSNADELAHAASELTRIAQASAAALVLGAGSKVKLGQETFWPLPASLSLLDVAAMCAWLGLATLGLWSARLPALGIRARVVALVFAALAIGALAQSLPHDSATLDGSAWKARAAADPDALCVFAPIAFGPSETDLARPLERPLASDAQGGRHWCGTDQLGRDLLARMLYAGRTSFAVAFLAAVIIVSLGSALGLAAGALRGIVDGVVLRAIELLQAFPTLVLLLGLVALLPAQLADSRWTMPLCIAAFGWTHIARLARAEALRVSELGFVQASVAAGFSRKHVILRHVLPNSLGPVWIAACFVLSAGLVLESAAAFLGFGIQLPAPSFGALLADARATQAWWLALFPGLWLFASILAIHLVGEGVRDALDPRESEAPR